MVIAMQKLQNLTKLYSACIILFIVPTSILTFFKNMTPHKIFKKSYKLQIPSTDWQKLIYGNCNAQIAKLYKIV